MKRDWQAELYSRHSSWIAGQPPLMAIGDGWSDVMNRLFDRVAVAIADEPQGTKVSIVDIKEKYGALDVVFMAPVGPAADAAIDRAVQLAEMASEATCDECGAPGKLRSTLGSSGWLAVKCGDHGSGYPEILAKGPPSRRVTDARGTFDVVYDRRSDTVTETPVEDEDSR